MAQHIGIRLEDANGVIRESCDINFAPVMDYLWTMPDAQEKYQFLSTIDEYGGTLINILQKPLLIKDLENLSNQSDNQELKYQIKEVISFLQKTKNHLYIRFMGD